MNDEALFTEDAVFLYHSRSADAPPGVGVGEMLRCPAETFAELARIEHWRRKLSNFAPTRFTLDGLTWGSVEHHFQAAKFARSAPDHYQSFSLDSGSELSRAEGAVVKSAGGRKGRPMSEADRAWWESVKLDVIERALFARFSQCEASRVVLLATGLAKLTHRPLRASHVRVEVELMRVRRRLRPG